MTRAERGPDTGKSSARGLGLPRVTLVLPRIGRAAGPGSWAEIGGRVFGWLTVLPVLLILAWLLPGLPLVLAGRFLPVPMILISVPVAALLAILAARCLPGRWPTPAGAGRWAAWAAWWGLAGTALVAAGFAAWQQTLDSPQLFVLRQPAVAVQLGYWIAEHAGLSIPAAQAAFGGSHAGLSLASYGFAARGGTLVPWQFPGLPIVLAGGSWVHGVAGIAGVSPILGAFAVLAVGGLTGRLAGLAWAPVGALAAALTLPEILTSRSAYAEPLAELLLIGGLCLVADSLTALGPDREGRLLGLARWPAGTKSAITAGLGGLALGLTALVQAGLLIVLLPAIPFAAALAARHRLRAASFGIGMLAGVGYGLAGGQVLAAPGMSTLAPSLRTIGLGAIWTASLTLAGLSVSYRPRARALLARRPLRWLPEGAAVVVLLVAAALAARPYLQEVRSGPVAAYVAWLQRLTGLLAGPRHLYAEDSLYWVIWYLGLPAVILAAAGLALLARRSAHALLTWRDVAGDARIQALPLLMAGWGAVTALWHPGTVPDQPWAGRILVPVVLPGFIVCGVWVAAWLAARARERGAGVPALAVAAVCFTAALVVPGAVTSFGAGAPAAAAGTRLTVAGVVLDGPAGQRTGAGETVAVYQLCGQIGQKSAVLIMDEGAARELAPVLRGMCGVPVGVMAGAAPGQVLAVAQDITRAGRRPVLLASSRGRLSAYRTLAQKIVDLSSRQDERFLTGPPEGTWPARYQVWIAAPATVAGM